MFLDRFKKKIRPEFMGHNEHSIMHLGIDTKGRPIRTDSNTIRTHTLVTGTTGAGKTAALIGFMSNAFAWGSGGIFVDGKGDINVYAAMAGLAEHYDRRDDLYVLNFMLGNGDASGVARRSHRFNPFEKGSSDSLTMMLTDIFADPSTPAMWTGRAVAMLTGLMRFLCWMRDEQGQYLDAAVIRNHLNLRTFIDIAHSERFDHVPPAIRKAVASYLSSLPSFMLDNGYGQSQETLSQHGFLEMQLTRMLGTMADVYGHIFCAGSSDIDMDDIINNRRFLLVLLPALEKSHDEIAMLGKVVLASLKRMAGGRLGRDIKGSWHDVSKSVAPHGPPFLCVFDEVGYYAVDGMDLLCAQARSLNIGLIFASQDMQALFNANSRVARSILATTRTKIIMRTESWDPELDELLFDAEAGRDDVRAAIRKTSRLKHGNLFGSARLFARELDEGSFLLVNSGKILVGKANYVMIHPKGPLSLARFASISDTTERLLQLEEERRHAETRGRNDMTDMIAPLAGASDAGGSDLLEAALKCILNADPQTSAPVREIVKTGV
ncbi:AAA-like domain protein [compost metagenome]